MEVAPEKTPDLIFEENPIVLSQTMGRILKPTPRQLQAMIEYADDIGIPDPEEY
jgi:hypothetical protein